MTTEPTPDAPDLRPEPPVAPGRIARIDRAVEQALSSAEVARRRSRVVDIAWTTGERDRATVGSVLAGAVAFRLFVYLLPLVLALLTLVGLVVGLDDDAPTHVGDGLGMSAYVVQSVADASEQAHRNLWFLVPLALWAVYSAGGAAARVLHAVHAVAWGLPRARMRRGVLAAGVTFVVALGALGAVGLTQWLRAESPGLGVGAALVGILPFATLWLGVSWLLPHDRRAPWTALVPGALLVGAGVWLIHLFSVYVLAHRVDKASSMYGSLGVAAALLAWLYLFGRLMVAGAMLNATLWERQTREREREGDAGPASGATEVPDLRE
ncbi:MAG: YhjD/YihY/BrkB family envelope integrity protein [Acidimicrobiales bacterium]|nr:YhjD/YihY/BrkB family envelope integrity protein [Acidimicrobiales bacterium]